MKNSCHETFSPAHYSSYIACCRFLVALSSLILCQFSASFIINQCPPIENWLTHKVHFCHQMKWLDRTWSSIDYTMTTWTWSNLTDQTGTYANRHIGRDTMESVYWFHKGWKNVINLYMKWRQITRTKKMIPNALITHGICPTGLHEAWKFYANRLLVNTYPLKVDRNLQWMSHHPTDPTYICVLSWAMTQLSAQL